MFKEQIDMGRKMVWATGIVGILLLGGGWAIWSDMAGQEARAQALRTVAAVQRDIGSSVLATGIVKPMVGAEVRVGSRVSGIVQRLRANIGDLVEKGDVLAELNPTELQARYDQATAAIENARANLDYARLNLKRQRSLLEQQFVAQDRVDLAEKAFQVAKSQVRQAEANFDFAQIQLGYTRITATISGVVASVSTQEGETVAASFSAPTFVTLIDLERLEVWAYVDETDIGRVRPGQRAIFTVDTYPEVEFEGEVTAIYPKAVIQDNVVNYITTIQITDRKDQILRPEMTTTVNIILETHQGVVAVPGSAVRRERGQRFVYMMEEESLIRRPVSVGWKDGEFLEIRSGLVAGDRVALGEVNDKIVAGTRNGGGSQ